MIKILYFARLSETLGLKSEELEPGPDCKSVKDLVAELTSRGEPFVAAFDGDAQVLVAVNQAMSEFASEVRDGDEVAFFPPVTGG
jgi:molybdopterin synthase sulfur carrier subunit